MTKYRIVEKTSATNPDSKWWVAEKYVEMEWLRAWPWSERVFEWVDIFTSYVSREDAEKRLDRIMHPEKYERVVYEAGE